MFDGNFRDVLRRQAAAFGLTLLIGLGITFLVVVFAPRKYQSQAKFVLRLGRENVAIDPIVTTTGELATLHRTRESEVQSEVQAMRSRRILERVVDQIGPGPILTGSLEKSKSGKNPLSEITKAVKDFIARLDPVDDRENAILVLQKGFSIEAERDSSVIDVRFIKSKTPELAQRIVDTWVNVYQLEHAKMNLAEGSYDFFRKQESQLLEKLQETHNLLQAKKSASGVLTLQGGQEILERQLQRAKLNRIELETKLVGTQARLESLRGLSEQTPSSILTGESTSHTSDARQQMRDRLYALEIEEKGVLAKYASDHPTHIALAQQLAQAREMYEKHQDTTMETIKGINPIHVSIMEQISLELANSQAFEAELKATDLTLDSLGQQLQSLNQSEIEMAALGRDVEALDSQYRTQFVKREQARLAEELEATNISNLRLIQDPTFERKPVSPNKLLCVFLGGVASFLLSAGFVALREAGFQMKQVELDELAGVVTSNNSSSTADGDSMPARMMQTVGGSS